MCKGVLLISPCFFFLPLKTFEFFQSAIQVMYCPQLCERKKERELKPQISSPRQGPNLMDLLFSFFVGSRL